MSQFVDECRREWKRLGVADAIANEMAADLETDLAEAEADGLAPENVLGDGVFDARGFAASWARERGVIPPAPPPSRLPRRSRRLSLVVAFIAASMLAVGIFVLGSHAHASVAVVAAARTTFSGPGQVGVVPGPPARPGSYVGPAGAKFVLPAVARDMNDKVRRIAWLLVILGGLGLGLAVALWPRGKPVGSAPPFLA